MFEYLYQDFVLVCIDMIGMGQSSRPDNFLKHEFTPQQSIDYFLDYIEKWREAMEIRDKMYFMGHSFGGYILGNYALRYPQYVEKILFVSPIGFRIREEGEDDWERFEAKSKEVKEAGGDPPSLRTKIWVKLQWSSKTSPFSLCKVVGKQQTKVLIEDYMLRRQKQINDTAKTLMEDFIYQLIMRPDTSECAFMVVMTQGL